MSQTCLNYMPLEVKQTKINPIDLRIRSNKNLRNQYFCTCDQSHSLKGCRKRTTTGWYSVCKTMCRDSRGLKVKIVFLQSVISCIQNQDHLWALSKLQKRLYINFITLKWINIFHCYISNTIYYCIKLRMELSKRQQPDHREDNSRRSPTGLQCSEIFPHLEASFSWPLNKYIYYVCILNQPHL